ncbi:MobA/MobL family protein [Hyphomicrobium sp.]|jgi:hypothetical protein|uniref:MobA/MobL family protein n=1 Tax=Hyphomicrobium sp. TaxID=82 RepID=UPI003564E5CB
MRVRSLPHFKHDHIGKTSHTKNFSYHHINYIMREGACTKVLAENMSVTREDARRFFEREAYREGVAANARVADTFIIALPIELDAEQRYDLVERFMHKIGKNRIAWLAGFHETGEDAHNPHCHVIFRDADIETGRKVLGTTTSAKDVKEAQDKGWRVPPRMTTKDLRVAWCKHINDDMKRLGINVRFDERRLKDQGIEREAEIHVGRKGHAMQQAGKDPANSEDRRRGNHVNPYTLVDTGSRHDHNERIKARNHGSNDNADPSATYIASFEEARQKTELREQQGVQRKGMYAEQHLDRAALRKAHRAQRRENERMGRVLYAGARAKAYRETGDAYKERWTAARQIKNHRAQRLAMKTIFAEQKAAYAIAAAAEVEKIKPEKNARWQAQQASQASERETLKSLHSAEQNALARQHVAERHALHERWQHTNMAKQADRLSAKFETQQSMAVVQTNAVKLIQLRNRQDRGAYTGSDEAIGFFTDTARAEADKRAGLRSMLDQDRADNLSRAAATSDRSRAQPGINVQKRSGVDSQARPDRRAANDQGRGTINDTQKGAGPPDNAKPANAKALNAKATEAKPDGKTEPKKDKSRNDDRQGDLFARYRKDYKDNGRDSGRSGR